MSKYVEPKNYVDAISEQYGWPKKISARGFTAYLCGLQPLNDGEKPLPVYRFPGGPSLVEESEMIPIIEGGIQNNEKRTE